MFVLVRVYAEIEKSYLWSDVRRACYRFPHTQRAPAVCLRRGCSGYSSNLLRARAPSRLIPAQNTAGTVNTQ